MRFMKLGMTAVIVATALLLAQLTGLIDLLTDVEALQAWIAEFGVLGYFVYFLIYILACVFAIPGSALTIVAGIVFGPVKGGLLALLGATVGASLAFLVSRFLMRDWIERRFGANPMFRKIDQGVAENGTSFLILTRLVPLFPFNLQNFAYGLTSLNLVTYAVVTLITMAPITFIFAYMAGDIATNGVSVMLLVKLGAAGIILSALSLVPKYIARRRGINMEELAG